MKVDGKPIFMIYKPMEIPNIIEMADLWNDLALKEGLKGLYFIGIIRNKEEPFHVDIFNAYMRQNLFRSERNN